MAFEDEGGTIRNGLGPGAATLAVCITEGQSHQS